MERLSVDVAVIGAGTAGLNARREVEKRGGRPLLIESTAYGTTCARVGCMPSKLLIAAAEAAHAIETAPKFGVHAGELRVDGAAVMRRVQRERDRFVGFVVADTEKIDPAQREFFVTGATALAAQGRLWMLGLALDGKWIALKCNFLAGSGGYAFKIAYDEKLSRFSPGVLLELETLSRLHARRASNRVHFENTIHAA